MLNIQDLKMQQPLPTPTEKAQIVIHYINPHPSLVVRFSSVKKAEKAHKELLKAWRTFRLGNSEDGVHHIPGDMFVADIDMSCIGAVMFIDAAKRDKFIPYRGE